MSDQMLERSLKFIILLIALILLAILVIPFTAEAQTSIYRSVQYDGDGTSAALATGTGNNLTISGTTATFASALPDTVGVGCAIQYDDDNDGDIDANDSICFIHGRTSSTVFTVATAAGGTPTATAAADQDWSIFHAYTSWVNMEAGTENNGIDADLRAFDAGNRDIGGANEDWYVAFYAGSETIGAAAIDFTGWTTGSNRIIKFFTPSSSSEVGRSQRHSGTWTGTCYSITKTDVDNKGIFDSPNTLSNFWIDGLQFYVNVRSNAGECYAMRFVNGTNIANIQVSNCIMRGLYDATATSRRRTGIYVNNLDNAASTLKIWNNIIYSFWTPFDATRVGGIHFDATNCNGTAYIYNNTLDSCRYSIVGNDGTVYAKNNIVQRTQDGFNGANFHADSNYNISDVASDAPGANSKNSTSVSFVSAANKNFLLQANDTAAKDAGTNTVTSDISATSTDILGTARPQGAAFDIGAHEVSGTSATLKRRRAIIQ